MKTKQQLLKEASLLKQELARVNRQINLTEVRRMQQLAGILKENVDQDLDTKNQIENWYWKTKFNIDDLSPEEVEQGIQAHYEEWMATKDAYKGNIQHYFDDVEEKGDWY